MAPTNRSLVNVTKPMVAKLSNGECTLGSPMSSLTVRAVGTKDRHSKVRTAKGLRDRRVRLSAPTAVQFFEVQDRLGFDQPSKALDWLIRNARTAIDELAPVKPVVLNIERDGIAMENISREINTGYDVDEHHGITLANVEQQQTSDLHGGSRVSAGSRKQDSMKEDTRSDEVLPVMSTPFTSSSITPESLVLSESKQLSTEQLPCANRHSIQRSSNNILPQTGIPLFVNLPTYSFSTASEPSGPLMLQDFPQHLQISAPAADHQSSASYCTTPISPGGTLQSIFNDVFTNFSNSHLQNVPIMELYPLMGLHDGDSGHCHIKSTSWPNSYMNRDAALPP